MNIFSLVWSGVKAVFGAGGGKDIVQETADIVDKFHPSPVTQHAMDLQDQQAADSSQASARGMSFISHNTWFDDLIDGLNRLPRPLFAFWAFGILSGLIPEPAQLNTLDSYTWNIIITVISFYFGIRFISKDIPTTIKTVQTLLKK